MNFEYDENKSKSNKLKHGIDFEEAQKLWDDHMLLSYLHLKVKMKIDF